MVRGSCLCGRVRYEIAGPLKRALNCHCSMCRKAHGAAFRTRASVRAEDFRWIAGQQHVKYYESSPGNHRGFCAECGSPILSRFDFDPTVLGVPFGCFDDDPGVKPTLHVHVASRAPWHDITDDLPRFDTLPERR